VAANGAWHVQHRSTALGAGLLSAAEVVTAFNAEALERTVSSTTSAVSSNEEQRSSRPTHECRDPVRNSDDQGCFGNNAAVRVCADIGLTTEFKAPPRKRIPRPISRILPRVEVVNDSCDVVVAVDAPYAEPPVMKRRRLGTNHDVCMLIAFIKTVAGAGLAGRWTVAANWVGAPPVAGDDVDIASAPSGAPLPGSNP
jgi:hypothetical protein